jgi:ABC-type branched-subunit amino acid transport system ATPase component/branched-subunit amino acid ABC-type transport system permease component
MSVVLTYAVLGLGVGGLYVLFALGLVITYRGSGVLNFAQGGVAMVGAYAFYEASTQAHWPWAASLIVGVGVATVISGLIHILVMRFLANASGLVRVIATLGILTVIQQAVELKYGSTPVAVESELPLTNLKIGAVTFGQNYLILLALSIVIAAGLWLVYRRTLFGVATSAGVENSKFLSALGFSPHRLALVNWLVGGALSGLAGVLLAPITGIVASQYTLLVLPALAAAVVGRLTSFPLTVAGGLLVGVIESEADRYISAPGWSAAAPFLLVIVALAVTGPRLVSRTTTRERLPRVGSGHIGASALIGVGLGIVLVFTLSGAWLGALTTTIVYAIILLSVVVVTGYSGQLSLGQFAIAGFGAWVAGRLAATAGVPFFWALIIGVVAALPLGLVLGTIALRTRDVTLAICTLGLAVALENVIFENNDYTGGIAGTFVGSPRIFGIDVDPITHATSYALVCLCALVVAGIAVSNMRRGRVGRRIISVRANPRAAAALGVDVRGVRLYAFTLAAGIAALGGILLAFTNTTIVYTQFDVLISLFIVAYVVVGGVGWVGGACIGALLVPGSLGSQTLDLLGLGVGQYLPLAGGVLVILTLIRAQDGLAYFNWAAYDRLRRTIRRRVRSEEPKAPRSAHRASSHRVRASQLRLENICVRFGGTEALAEISVEVNAGEVVGLIGPNGAGKTTLIDAATGFVRVKAGRVYLEGRDITSWRPNRRAKAGLVRSFQSVELFEDMTVLDNLRVASAPAGVTPYVTDLLWPRVPALGAAAEAAIAEFGLTNLLERSPKDLSYGERRLVAIGRAVAAEPSVLLLDEPAAGLGDADRGELRDLVRRLASEWGMAILLIEHDVPLVMSACDRVYALNFGRLIASGTPAEVRADARVVSSYLGETTLSESA